MLKVMKLVEWHIQHSLTLVTASFSSQLLTPQRPKCTFPSISSQSHKPVKRRPTYILIQQHTTSRATEYHQFHYASPVWIQGLLCHSFFGSFLKIWQIRQDSCISECRILLRFTRRLMWIVSGKFPQWNCDQKSECLFFSTWLLGWVIVFLQLWWKVLTRSNL